MTTSPRPIGPSWSHQPEQKGVLWSRFVPPTGTNVLGPLIPFLLLPPEPFSSLVLTVLGSGEGSSCSFTHHIYEDLSFPRPSTNAKGLGLVSLFFHCLGSSFHALEIEKICSSFLTHLDCICRCDLLFLVDPKECNILVLVDPKS